MDEELTDVGPQERKFAVTVRTEGQCKRILSIDIPEEAVELERERITERLRRDLKVPGFRRGKVPLAYVKKNYAGAIHGDAVQNLLPRVYEDALVSEGLHPLGEPHFDNLRAEPGSGIQAEAIIEVRPEVEVRGYRDVPVDVDHREVTDADVTSTLNDLRERMASYETVEREAKSTDFVTIDYVPYLESGGVDEKARQKNHTVELASESLFEEFRVGLVGKKAGDETELSVKYPDDFADRALAGRAKRFQVKVIAVKEKLLPELDDAFAQRLSSEVGTLEALRGRIREDLVHEEKHRFEHELEEKVIDHLIAQNPFEVPAVMVENYLSSILEEDRRRRPRVQDEAQRTREVRELFGDAAVRSIKKYFIMDAIRRQENVEADDAEVEAKIESIAKDAGKDVDEVREYFAHPERNRRLKGDMVDAKVMALLRGEARVAPVKGGA